MDNIKIICNNKKAKFNYFLSEFTECGISLKGSEIKSLRAGHCSLDDSYVVEKNNELYVINMNIPINQNNNTTFIHEPLRTRKLLLHKREINFFVKSIKTQGYTIVPVKVYIKNGLCKIEIALGKGKKNYDKREIIKQRDIERSIKKH